MAQITADKGIAAILKTWYKDGVQNLLVPRNDPLLREIQFTKVEGKEQRFAALYSRGGAVGANFLVAKKKATETAKNAEFIVTPGQLFSAYTFNAKEVQASLSKRGAYMKIAGNKFFAANQAFRSTLAATLYGRGYGEIGLWESGASAAAMTANTPYNLELSLDTMSKLDIDSALVLKETTSGAELVELTVSGIDESNGVVTVLPAAAFTPDNDKTYVVALKGSMDSGNGDGSGLAPAGNPLMPLGLDAWLPIVNGRTGAAWDTYINTAMFGVNRSIAPDRLAGQFYQETDSNAKKVDTISKLIYKIRHAGGNPDLILVNEVDRADIDKELEYRNVIYSDTANMGKKKATTNFSDLQFAASTNWIDVVYDSPYVPQGKFYIIDKTGVEYFVYTNADLVKDGISGNEPGKQDVMSADDKGKENEAFKLLIDDVLSVVPGESTMDGESVRATINFFGTLAVSNPSVNGVGLFYTATPEKILGWQA